MKKIIFLFLMSLILTSCSTDVITIMPGYKAKILTPTGWQDKLYDAGQVDIGNFRNGEGNSLVLIEATTVTVKESFTDAYNSPDKQDHRIMTSSGTPLTVDIYVQFEFPQDDKLINNAFIQVTPVKYQDQSRVYIITLEDIYKKYAQMNVRGKTREIFAKYKNDAEAIENYEKANAQISKMIIDVFAESKAPLHLISGQLSNIKVDNMIWEMKNKLQAAETDVKIIKIQSDALAQNPQYLEKLRWESLIKISEKGNLIIMTDGKTPTGINLPTR